MIFSYQSSPNRSSQKIDSKNQETQKIKLDCHDKPFSQDCYIKDFYFLAKASGTELAKNVLSKLQEIDPTTNDCHTIAHSIGRAAVEKNPDNWKQIIDGEDPNFCSGGFFHGAIEAHARFDNNFNVTGPEANNLCDYGNYPYREGSCKHALGHIILVDTQGNLAKAVTTCDLIKPPFEDECYGGVFMENVVRQNLKDHGIGVQYNWDRQYANKNEVVCQNQLGKAAKGCWGEMGHLYAAINNDEGEKTFQECYKAREQSFIDNCYKLAIQKMSVTADQPKLNRACNVYTNLESKYTQCVGYVISSITNTSANLKTKGINFCDSLLEIYKKDCLNQIEKTH